MKIIYDDIIYSLQRSGGISLYWSQLEKYIRQDIQLLFRNYEKNIFYYDSPISQKIKKKDNILLERYKNIVLPDDSSFIFHSSYYRYCKNKNAINIITLYDFNYEYFRCDATARLHIFQKKNAIKHAHGIIAISENTKNDLMKLYPFYDGKISVIYLGISNEYMYLNLPKKNIIIFIGERSGYKNFKYTIELVKNISELKLHIIGGEALSKEERIHLNKSIPYRYEYYSNISNEELNIKYNEAKFLLYPSLYEGFGIPVIEAQAAGCPVVCCNTSSLPEVGGDAAIYISGRNMEDDLKKIEQLNDQMFYKNMLKKGFENCRRFSWEKCAEETYNFYKEVYDLYKE